MSQPETVIVGAGFAGLLAAFVFPRARILEAAPGPAQSHRALLRFRSEVVSELTGIPFRRVRVRKGIWHAGGFQPANIALANLYTQKVLGKVLGERSIWNLDPVDRWIAPETFYEQLVERHEGRILWGTRADFGGLVARKQVVINTAPLPLVMEALGVARGPEIEFARAPIRVRRWRLPKGTSAHQTVYFPAKDHKLYRASITDDLLICEFSGEETGDALWQRDLVRAFALDWLGEDLGTVEQKYGKIIELPAEPRRALLHELTAQHGVFSLGRFATWRNVLLDDVVHDARVVQRLVGSSVYERRLHASGLQPK